MSSLYPRGKSIYIQFKDQRGVHHDIPTGIKCALKKRDGRWVFPPEAIDFKRRIDAEIALDRFNLKPKCRGPLAFPTQVQNYSPV